MLNKDRAAHLFKRLEELYPQTPIPLDHRDPYTLLIAVLLSAQCTDVRVNLITPALFALANTPEKMIEIPEVSLLASRPCRIALNLIERGLIGQFTGLWPSPKATEAWMNKN